MPQAVLGNPHWPWQPIGERDAHEVIEQIRARGPRVVALSGHDSTPWTFEAFRSAFGDGYSTMRVGTELRSAPTGPRRPSVVPRPRLRQDQEPRPGSHSAAGPSGTPPPTT